MEKLIATLQTKATPVLLTPEPSKAVAVQCSPPYYRISISNIMLNNTSTAHYSTAE